VTTQINGLELAGLSILPRIANQVPLSEFKAWLCLDRYGRPGEPNEEYIVSALPFLDSDRERIALRLLAESPRK